MHQMSKEDLQKLDLTNYIPKLIGYKLLNILLNSNIPTAGLAFGNI